MKSTIEHQLPAGLRMLDANDLQRLNLGGRNTVYNILRNPETGSVRIGKRLYISEECLRTWLIKQAATSDD